MSPDSDPQLEYYTTLDITMSRLGSDLSEWHVAYRISLGLGMDESGRPPVLREADNEERLSEWWE